MQCKILNLGLKFDVITFYTLEDIENTVHYNQLLFHNEVVFSISFSHRKIIIEVVRKGININVSNY